MLLLTLMASFALDAHAGKRGQAPENDMPTWFLTPPPGCAGGSALFDVNMREMSKIEADTNARADLSRQVQSHVTSLVQSAFQKSSDGDGKSESSSSATSVTKTATDTALLGARAVGSEVRGSSLYLLVCIEPESLVKAFEEMAYLDDAMKVALAEDTRTSYSAQTAQLVQLGMGR